MSSVRWFDSLSQGGKTEGEEDNSLEKGRSSCGKGEICCLCLLGIGIKLQCERFNLGTRENLLSAGIGKH